MFTECNNLINRTQQPWNTAFFFALKPYIRFGTWRRPAAAPHKFLGFFRRVFIIFWRFCQEKFCENVFINFVYLFLGIASVSKGKRRKFNLKFSKNFFKKIESVFIHMIKTRGTLYTCSRKDIVSTVTSRTATPCHVMLTWLITICFYQKHEKNCGDTDEFKWWKSFWQEDDFSWQTRKLWRTYIGPHFQTNPSFFIQKTPFSYASTIFLINTQKFIDKTQFFLYNNIVKRNKEKYVFLEVFYGR